MKKLLLFGYVMSSWHAFSQPQIPITSSATSNMGGGTTALNQNFVIDWSIGESTVIDTWHGENSFGNSVIGVHWNVTSGILQPRDIQHVLFNYLVPTFTTQEISFHPIPTPDLVNINFHSLVPGTITIHLYSQDGKMLDSKSFYQTGGSNHQTWNLGNRVSGMYLFKIRLSSALGSLLKEGTFKVEKNK